MSEQDFCDYRLKDFNSTVARRTNPKTYFPKSLLHSQYFIFFVATSFPKTSRLSTSNLSLELSIVKYYAKVLYTCLEKYLHINFLNIINVEDNENIMQYSEYKQVLCFLTSQDIIKLLFIVKSYQNLIIFYGFKYNGSMKYI